MYGHRTDDRYSFDSLEVSLRQRIRWTRVELQSEGHSTAAIAAIAAPVQRQESAKEAPTKEEVQQDSTRFNGCRIEIQLETKVDKMKLFLKIFWRF